MPGPPAHSLMPRGTSECPSHLTAASLYGSPQSCFAANYVHLVATQCQPSTQPDCPSSKQFPTLPHLGYSSDGTLAHGFCPGIQCCPGTLPFTFPFRYLTTFVFPHFGTRGLSFHTGCAIPLQPTRGRITDHVPLSGSLKRHVCPPRECLQVCTLHRYLGRNIALALPPRHEERTSRTLTGHTTQHREKAQSTPNFLTCDLPLESVFPAPMRWNVTRLFVTQIQLVVALQYPLLAVLDRHPYGLGNATRTAYRTQSNIAPIKGTCQTDRAISEPID